MNLLSDRGARESRRTALAWWGAALLIAGLTAVPAGAGQHQPHGSSGSSSGSASSRSGSSSSPSSATSSHSSDSGSRHAVPRGSVSAGSSEGRTPHHSSHHHGGYYGHGYGYYGPHYSYYPSFGYYWWNSFYSPWWAWGGPRVYVSTYPDRDDDELGAIDTDVAPENAEVYVDGELVGRADDYDGWPSYLWLEKGTYDVVFYHEGFRTMARQITVRPGGVVDVEDEMERGDAVKPADLGTKSHERRDARLAEEAEKQAAAEARERDGEPAWRERIRSERRARGEAPPAYGSGERDLREQPAQVDVRIEPSDAAVYLDGRFIDNAARLQVAESPLLLSPGDHEIEVVRPGYGSKKQTFTVKSGERIELDIRLDHQE